MVGATLRLGVKIASLNQSSDHCANLAPPCFAPKFPMGLGWDISDILDVEQQVQDGFLWKWSGYTGYVKKNQNGHFCAGKLARLAFFPKLEARTAPVEGRNSNFALKLYSQKASRMTPKRSKRIQWQTRVSTVILGQRIVLVTASLAVGCESGSSTVLPTAAHAAKSTAEGLGWQAGT